MVEQEAVDWGWGFEPGGTMFAIVNAYALGARFRNYRLNYRYRPQKAEGNILEMV